MATYKKYNGKKISILGDSISTFVGYIPVADGKNLEHRARYPQDNLLCDVSKTWWMRVIDTIGAELCINDSWAGSTVSNWIDGNKGDIGEDIALASLTRIENLGSKGMPDVIFLYGGTNDIGKYVKKGSFDEKSAPTSPNLSAKKWDSFVDAYCEAVLRLRHFYPEAEIIALSPSFTRKYYDNEKLDLFLAEMFAICKHYGVEYLDVRQSGITLDMLPDGLHPNEEGMKCISDALLGMLAD